MIEQVAAGAQAAAIPPHSIEAEQALLGGILVNNDAFDLAEKYVTAESFFEPIHAHLFSQIVRARRNGMGITVTLMRAWLGEIGLADVAGMTLNEYVARLAASATTIINVPDYAKTIREFANCRVILETARQMTEMAHGATSYDVAMNGIDALDAILSSRAENTTPRVSIGAAGIAAIDCMALAYQNDGRITGFTTGLEDLDNRTLGLQRGDFIILAGRPGMGKSAAGLAFCMNSANAGNSVLFNSLEMHDVQLGMRALADITYHPAEPINYQRIARGKVTEAEQKRLMRAADTLNKLPILIEQTPGMTVGQIAARARKRQRELERAGKRLDILAVDHLHIVKASDRYKGRVEEVGEISFGLKCLAKELDCAVLALAQLNRKTEDRSSEARRPQLADLKWSGDIEQDADTIILIFREAYYLERELESLAETPDHAARRAEIMGQLSVTGQTIEFIVAKQRMGPIGTSRAFCEIGCNAIRNEVFNRFPWG